MWGIYYRVLCTTIEVIGIRADGDRQTAVGARRASRNPRPEVRRVMRTTHDSIPHCFISPICIWTSKSTM